MRQYIFTPDFILIKEKNRDILIKKSGEACRMIKKNFHTHTTFCDGKSSAEEMVISAIEKGFCALGFSAHSYEEYDDSWCISPDNMPKYKAEIFRLKEKYIDKIKIYYGIELDSFSETDVSEFEYTIASVHAVLKDGKYYSVDESEDVFVNNVNEGWNGDYLAFAKDYFEAVGEQSGDIVGHIDLLTKYNEGDRLFSARDEKYLLYAENAIKKLIEKNMLFEINTGAISRGCRTTPYPSEEILRLIKKHGGKVTINSDCHHKDNLDCGYDEAYALAQKCGFEKIHYLFED